jgi:hypothetical protein
MLQRTNAFDNLQNELKTMTAHDISSNQRMRVCEICGAFLAATDDDKR